MLSLLNEPHTRHNHDIKVRWNSPQNGLQILLNDLLLFIEIFAVLASHIHHQNTEGLDLKHFETIRLDLRDSCIDVSHAFDFLKDCEFILGSNLDVCELSTLCENAGDVVSLHGVIKKSLENVTVILFDTTDVLCFLSTQMIIEVPRNEKNHNNEKGNQNRQVVLLLLDEFWQSYTNVEVTSTIRIAELQKVDACNWVS